MTLCTSRASPCQLPALGDDRQDEKLWQGEDAYAVFHTRTPAGPCVRTPTLYPLMSCPHICQAHSLAGTLRLVWAAAWPEVQEETDVCRETVTVDVHTRLHRLRRPAAGSFHFMTLCLNDMSRLVVASSNPRKNNFPGINLKGKILQHLLGIKSIYLCIFNMRFFLLR